jgi:hypothetical protein
MLKWNPNWNLAALEPLNDSAEDAVRAYASSAYKVQGVHGVWAMFHGSVMTVYTLIVPDRDTERHLHEVELYVRDQWPDLPVRFEIYRDDESPREHVAGIEPILIAA